MLSDNDDKDTASGYPLFFYVTSKYCVQDIKYIVHLINQFQDPDYLIQFVIDFATEQQVDTNKICNNNKDDRDNYLLTLIKKIHKKIEGNIVGFALICGFGNAATLQPTCLSVDLVKIMKNKQNIKEILFDRYGEAKDTYYYSLKCYHWFDAKTIKAIKDSSIMVRTNNNDNNNDNKQK